VVVTTPSRAPDSPPVPGYLRAPVPVHFPSFELAPQTKRHLEQRTTLWEILTLAFRKQAAIGCNQFVYWDPTDPRQSLAPDAFIRMGATDNMFDNWKVWERGAPDVAVEILSDFDERDRNLEANLDKYRRLGIRELVVFDSEREPPSLRVWDSVEGDLVERAVDGLAAPSLCLPATWIVVPDDRCGSLLRLSRDAEGKDLLPTPVEHARQGADVAEERIRELEAELQKRKR